jgi:UDP-GlcNAc:undecaprenyl-phosphate GlcNAc-1-phosphate transferase
LRSYVAAFLLAALLVALLTPLVAILARRVGAITGPGGRHVHQNAIPRLGGVAIAIACCTPLAAIFWVDSAVARTVNEHWQQPLAVLCGGLLMCTVGAIDDIRVLRASTKLVMQVVGAAVAYALGLRIEAVYLPYIGVLYMGVFALPVTVLWIVGITNAVNLIDGLDGLAAGIVFFASATNLIVAWVSGSVLVGLVMASVMGSVTGFLLYNFAPARIFMGDSGSYFLGYVLATTALAGSMAKASTAVSLLVPLVALGVPVFDTMFSMARRFLQRRSIFAPDREHIHHRLLDLGLTHKRTVLTLYGASIAFMAAAIALALGRDWSVGVAMLFATVLVLGMVRFGRYFDTLRLPKAPGSLRPYDSLTQRLRATIADLMPLATLNDAAELQQELDRVFRAAGFQRLEIRKDGELLSEWSSTPSITSRVVVSRSFEVSPTGESGRTRVAFFWDGDSVAPTPQADILLHVVADFLGRSIGDLWTAAAHTTASSSRALELAAVPANARPPAPDAS